MRQPVREIQREPGVIGAWAGGSLTRIAADHQFIANHKQRQRKRFNDCFSEDSFTVAWWTYEKNAMSGFQAVSAQEIGSVMLLNKLDACSSDDMRMNKIFKPPLRLIFCNEIATSMLRLCKLGLRVVSAVGYVIHGLGQLVGEYVVLF